MNLMNTVSDSNLVWDLTELELLIQKNESNLLDEEISDTLRWLEEILEPFSVKNTDKNNCFCVPEQLILDFLNEEWEICFLNNEEKDLSEDNYYTLKQLLFLSKEEFDSLSQNDSITKIPSNIFKKFTELRDNIFKLIYLFEKSSFSDNDLKNICKKINNLFTEIHYEFSKNILSYKWFKFSYFESILSKENYEKLQNIIKELNL